MKQFFDNLIVLVTPQLLTSHIAEKRSSGGVITTCLHNTSPIAKTSDAVFITCTDTNLGFGDVVHSGIQGYHIEKKILIILLVFLI